MMMEQGDFAKRLNVFKKKEGNASTSSRRTPANRDAIESFTSTRSSSTSSRIRPSFDSTNLPAQQEEEILEESIGKNTTFRYDRVSTSTDEADADDGEKVPVTPTRGAASLKNTEQEAVSYAHSPSYSLASIAQRQDDEVSYAQSPSYSLASVVRQPAARRLTPLNFYQAQTRMVLNDSNAASTSRDYYALSSHFPFAQSSAQLINPPPMEAMRPMQVDQQYHNEFPIHTGAGNATTLASNPFRTPMHGPNLKHADFESHLNTRVEMPPEPAVTLTRTAFPKELPSRPMRHSRHRFITTAQRQEALLEQERRRQAQLHTRKLHTRSHTNFVSRALPIRARSKALNVCGIILLIIVQCSFGSSVAAGSYMVAVQKNSTTSERNTIGSTLWFWLITSVLILIFSLGMMALICLCGKLNTDRGSSGFLSRLGLNEIATDDADTGIELSNMVRVSQQEHVEELAYITGRTPRVLDSTITEVAPAERKAEPSKKVSSSRSDRHRDLTLNCLNGLIPPVNPKVITTNLLSSISTKN
jgi:hypothetical protein